jgi:hypothetical protein
MSLEATMAKKTREGPEPGKEKFTVYLTREQRLALLRQALDESEATGERVSATQIVERLITQYLARKGAQHGH